MLWVLKRTVSLGSFKHPKYMFELMNKKIIAILRWQYFLNWPYDWFTLQTCALSATCAKLSKSVYMAKNSGGRSRATIALFFMKHLSYIWPSDGNVSPESISCAYLYVVTNRLGKKGSSVTILWITFPIPVEDCQAPLNLRWCSWH